MEWDLAQAETQHAEAAKVEAAHGYDIELTMARVYWEGYVSGVQNALHALDGMDADHD